MPISPAPTFDLATREDTMQAAMDMPFSPLQTIAQGAQTGFQSTSIGQMVRGATTPAGNEMPTITGNPLIDAMNAPANIRAGIEGVGRLLSGQPNPPMSQADYEASPYFRKGVPWDPGMTEDRAASLATQFDQTQARNYFGQKSPVYSFLGNFLGGAADPINFIPVFGEAAHAAAAARFGILGSIGMASSEAALNTAALDLMTAQNRARYGDDVSWQATINDIAFSALAGAVLTPLVHGGIKAFDTLSSIGAERAKAAVQSRAETVPNMAQARDVLNDSITSMATTGDVRLTPASEDTVRSMAADVVTKRDAAVALNRETSGITADRPGQVVITPSGARVEVRPEVVDLRDLIAASGDLQVRDRTRAASAAQIEEMGRNLDPARLMPSIEADRGAPIVGPDNVVDSGNGRVAAIQRAYEAYPEQATAYRKAVEAQGYSTEGIDQPVLVSRRVTPLSPEARAQFNAEANQSATARMAPSELAQVDANAMTDDVLRAKAEGPVTSAENRPFVDGFLARVPQSERPALLARDGSLSAEGTRRIENALVAKAYGDIDPSVVQRFSDATDDNSRAIMGAMSDVSGKWALMRRAMKAGEIDPALDVTPELTTALRKLTQWRDQAAREGRPVPMVIKEGLGQLDLLDGELSLEAKTLVRAFYKTDDFVRSAGRDTIAARLNSIIDEAEAIGRPQLFADAEAATKLGILRHVVNDDLEANLFTADDAGTRPQQIRANRGEPAAGADRGNAAQGAEDGQGGGPGEPSLIPATDFTAPRPDAVPDGLKQAETRTGTSEDIHSLAEQHGVSEDGSFPELGDIAILKDQGLLTEADQAELDAADKTMADATSWGEALKTAARCAFGA